MLKDKFMQQINNENHYTVPNYVLLFAKEASLDANSLILLIYFLNQKNKDIFNYKKILNDLSFTEKELLESISVLKDKKILSISMEKNESGILEERVDISSFYDIIFSKFLEEEKEKANDSNLYSEFEKEFGRTLSPMEYEIINSWLESKISNDLILAALKEAVFNGVTNLRYIDKIIRDWDKKGIKNEKDVLNDKKKYKEKKQNKLFDYDWLNERDN